MFPCFFKKNFFLLYVKDWSKILVVTWEHKGGSMIYFIGDKPSKNNIDTEVAFVGTRSYKTLLDWIYRMNLSINKICLYNADDFVRLTDNNKIITIHEHDQVVALGREASRALDKAIIPHLKIPHPSGLNRKLNDPQEVNRFLKECKDYVNS